MAIFSSEVGVCGGGLDKGSGMVCVEASTWKRCVRREELEEEAIDAASELSSSPSTIRASSSAMSFAERGGGIAGRTCEGTKADSLSLNWVKLLRVVCASSARAAVSWSYIG